MQARKRYAVASRTGLRDTAPFARPFLASLEESRPVLRIRIMALYSWRLDLLLGTRMLVKHPALTLVGGFGIAVAVAISAAGFSVIYGNFLASDLPLHEGHRLVSIELWDQSANRPERRVRHDFRCGGTSYGSSTT